MTAPSTLGQGLTVGAMAEEMLAVIVEHFAAAGVGLPARQLVAPGAPDQVAWDCEQLVVTVQGLGWGPAVDAGGTSAREGSPVSAFGVRHVVLNAQLIRCDPPIQRNGKPSDAAIHAAGVSFMRDVGLISQATVTATARVKRMSNGSALAVPGVVDPVGPAGGYHGLETTLAITVGDLA